SGTDEVPDLGGERRLKVITECKIVVVIGAKDLECELVSPIGERVHKQLRGTTETRAAAGILQRLGSVNHQHDIDVAAAGLTDDGQVNRIEFQDAHEPGGRIDLSEYVNNGGGRWRRW